MVTIYRGVVKHKIAFATVGFSSCKSLYIAQGSYHHAREFKCMVNIRICSLFYIRDVKKKALMINDRN